MCPCKAKPKRESFSLTGDLRQWENAWSKMGSGRGGEQAHHEEAPLQARD
jgi:hypothetical protein